MFLGGQVRQKKKGVTGAGIAGMRTFRVCLGQPESHGRIEILLDAPVDIDSGGSERAVGDGIGRVEREGAASMFFQLRTQGIGAAASHRCQSERCGLAEQSGRLFGVVGEDHAGPGAPNAEQSFHHHAVAINPAIAGGRLNHRVLARNLIGGQR